MVSGAVLVIADVRVTGFRLNTILLDPGHSEVHVTTIATHVAIIDVAINEFLLGEAEEFARLGEPSTLNGTNG